jgi:hypothetical protein
MGFPGGDVTITPLSEITASNTFLHGELRAFWTTGLNLNPGNSGGPVFDRLGTVVGIADAIRDDNAQAISFVVPIQEAFSLLANAGAEKSLAGPCAELPVCAHSSHGIDHFEVDVNMTGHSGWRGGGYNQTAYCNDYLGYLNVQYPNSAFTRLSSGEDARWTGTFGRTRNYNYYCVVRRQENPIYKQAAGVECLSK